MEGNREVRNEFTHVWAIAFDEDMKTSQQEKKLQQIVLEQMEVST